MVVRSSIASAWVVDTSSSDTGCARSRASAAIAWTAIPSSLRALSARPGCSPSPSGRPVSGAWRSFTARSAALVRTCATTRRARSSAVARAATSKLPTDTSRPSSTSTSGFDWCALSSRSTCSTAKPSASRAAPWSCGMVRKLSGSWSERALTPLPSSSARSRSSVSSRPGDGRTDASAGWSSASRFAPSASRSSAPATSRVASSSLASWIARAAWPVENAFWFRRAMPSPGAGASSPRRPTARSAVCARSACPIEPSDRTGGRSSSFSARTTRSASSGRAAESPWASAFARRSAAARTTSRGSAGPWAIRCWRSSSAS